MISIFTIAYNAMPFIEQHYPEFCRLTIPWRWIIIEGAAMNNFDTKWCRPQLPGISTDGTLEYIESILDPRVLVISRPKWNSKTEMVNSAVAQIIEPCVLLEVDADEVHTAENIEKIHRVLSDNPAGIGRIRMPCRFFVGPDLICVGTNCWSNRDKEWLRAWNYVPGMRFISHEPPSLQCFNMSRTIERPEAIRLGLTFNHYAYVTPQQVKYKERFYGYTGLYESWKRLQQHDKFPVRLDEFFPFAKPSPMVVRI